MTTEQKLQQATELLRRAYKIYVVDEGYQDPITEITDKMELWEGIQSFISENKEP